MIDQLSWKQCCSDNEKGKMLLKYFFFNCARYSLDQVPEMKPQ
jgi:hypothetical protein